MTTGKENIGATTNRDTFTNIVKFHLFFDIMIVIAEAHAVENDGSRDKSKLIEEVFSID